MRLFVTALGLLALQLGLLASPARAVVPEWNVVRLQDKSSAVNCRVKPDNSSRVVAIFREGTAVEAQYYDGKSVQIFQSSSFVPGARRAHCFMSASLVKPLDTDNVRGFVYGGDYRVATILPLGCRTFPGTEAPLTRRFARGTQVNIRTIGFDSKLQAWGRTEFGCYVIAQKSSLTRVGPGESPDAMCHYLKDPC
jgi:hypothetical protein